ncbi:glycosyltransferase family 4 protein [Roseitalea porphyridii]|jgi:glycosyltransferase involved in cell wall biosynthesis|uniref:glycosyltransferase family 4 protein n=1 Tax=Alphaproteobacteria TaxID=28211 RepID=UPI0032ED1591
MPHTAQDLAKPVAAGRTARVSLLTNMVPPYRDTLFSAIAASLEVAQLRVLVCTEREVDREWSVPGPTTYTQERLSGFTLNLRRGQDGRRILHFRFGIFWDLLRHRPDALIIGDASWTSYLGAAACRLYRIPYVVWNEITTASRISRGIPALLRGWLYRGASGFIASGEAARDYLLSKTLASSSIAIAHNTVDNAFFEQQRAQYAPERSKLRAELGIDDAAFCFIFVGQLISRKRVMETLELIARVAHVRPVHLLVAGSGPLEEHVRKRSQELAFDAVTFSGFTNSDRLSQLYVASDALILLSSDEPWGMVINEIMLFRKGFLATPEVGAAIEMADGMTRRCIPFDQIETEVIVDYVDACQTQACTGGVAPTSPEQAAEVFVSEVNRIAQRRP